MKKRKLLLFTFAVATMFGATVAGNISTTNLSSPYEHTNNSSNGCVDSESTGRIFYINGQSYTRQNTRDNFGNTNADSRILTEGSKVEIWRNNGVLTACDDWSRISNIVKQSSYDKVLAFLNNNGCTFNKPTYSKIDRPTAIDAQIHYIIGYYQKKSRPGGETLKTHYGYKDFEDAYWTCYAGGTGNLISDCDETTFRYNPTLKLHKGECIDYRLFRCGDGLVNGRDKNGTVIINYDNGPFTEQCDPNDPTHAGRGNGGCSPSCQPINNTQPQCGNEILEAGEQCEKVNGQFLPGCTNCLLDKPTCSITVNPDHGPVPQEVTITKNMPSWATVIYMNLGIGSNITNPIFPYHYTYTNAGSYQIKLKVRNNYDSYGVPYSGNLESEQFVARCYAYFTGTTPPPAQYCGDGILQSNEQCDPGSGNFGNGCNENCQLMTPTCTLTVNPNQGNIPLTTTINGTKPSWATYLSLNFGDGSPLQNNPVFTLTHTYNTVGTFNLTLTVQNNYNGQVNGTKPTATCSANVTATQPGSPVPYLLKQQKTGGMANFTTNQINVEIGETITYKVNFGNSGTVAATGEVWDILPPCVNYLTSSIHLPNGVTYNGPITTPYLDQTMVKYKDFRLQPGQGGYMLIQAQIRGTGAHGTTSCQNITSYLNTGYFKFVGGNTLSSQVIAVRPQAPQLPHLTIVKELLTNGNVSVGDYVGYKITLRNIGSGMAYNAYILDTMPRALQYISSNIQGVTNYLFSGWMDTNGQYNVKYYNFNLAPNQSAVVYLTGRLLDGYSFGDLTNCASTSGAVDCVIISGSPVPYLLKQQKTGGMANFTSNQINVQIGETITYKVNFGNSGTVAATGEVWDILPPCVNYLTSSIHLPNGVTYNGPITTPYLDQTMVKYKDFRLQPGQGGYMLIQAQIRGTGAHGTTSCQNITSYLNTGYFKFVGGNTLSSQVIAVRPESSSNVIFDKTGNKNLMYPGETGLEFYITVTNQGPNPISNIYVDDIWPDNETCIIYDGWTGTKLEEVSHLRRHYIGGDAGLNQGTLNGRVSDKGGADDGKTNVGNGGGAGTNSQQTSNGILYAGQSFNFTIFAHVADNSSCIGSYVNTGKLTYTEGGSSHVLYDDYPFQVITTPNIKVSIVKTVDHQYVNHNDTVTYTITYTNNGTAPLTNYVIKDYWPAMVEFISSTPYTNDIVVDGNGTLITWHFSTPLGVGESATITAVGRVR